MPDRIEELAQRIVTKVFTSTASWNDLHPEIAAELRAAGVTVPEPVKPKCQAWWRVEGGVVRNCAFDDGHPGQCRGALTGERIAETRTPPRPGLGISESDVAGHWDVLAKLNDWPSFGFWGREKRARIIDFLRVVAPLLWEARVDAMARVGDRADFVEVDGSYVHRSALRALGRTT